MSMQNLLVMLLILFVTACQTIESNTPQTPKTAEETEYILNEHDFGDYKKFKKDKSLNELKAIQKNKKPQTKEDSMKAYIKELTHHFQLPEKQEKSLEYIYEKYDEIEIQLNSPADSVQLAKTLEEKERTIERVLGEQLYASKGSFDKQYIKKLQTPEGTWHPDDLDQYLNDLSVSIDMDDNKKAALKRLINSYDESIKRANDKAAIVLNSRRNEAINKLLGEHLFEKKTIFDETYFK